MPGVIDVNAPIKLIWQASIEAMAEPLSFRAINAPDRPFKTPLLPLSHSVGEPSAD